VSITDSRANFQTPHSIYQALVEHQRNAEWWAHRDELEWLRDWGQTFIKEFSIKIKDGQFLPMPLVKIEPLGVRVTCAYRAEPDGYALAGAIVMNERLDVPDATKLALLLLTLFDAWGHQRCPDDVFDHECRQRFKATGLAVTKTGITIEQGGRFEQLLRKHGIDDIPANEIPWPKAEQTKDKLWSCRCQKVRTSAEWLGIQCLRCQTLFFPGNHVARGARGGTVKAARARTDAR
jgi:hypothetical protein